MAGLGLTKEINDPETKIHAGRNASKGFQQCWIPLKPLKPNGEAGCRGDGFCTIDLSVMRGKSALQAQENIEDLAQFVVPFRLVLCPTNN
jgi:hypothetical protein